MATHSSTLAWRIPWTEEPGGLQSTGHKESDTTERLHLSGPSSNECNSDILWKVQMVQVSPDYIMTEGRWVLFSVLYECSCF